MGGGQAGERYSQRLEADQQGKPEGEGGGGAGGGGGSPKAGLRLQHKGASCVASNVILWSTHANNSPAKVPFGTHMTVQQVYAMPWFKVWYDEWRIGPNNNMTLGPHGHSLHSGTAEMLT